MAEADWIKPDITDQDTAILFVWGADFAAGACIGLISLALMDQSNALIYYMDDQLKYSREMLLADTPLFLAELEKKGKRTQQTPPPPSQNSTPEVKRKKKKGFWDWLNGLFD